MGRMKTENFHHILESIDGRLKGWKTKYLTLTRRITLAKLVLMTTPSYLVQSAFLPKTLCDNIDKKVRNFIWGNSRDGRKLHLVN